MRVGDLVRCPAVEWGDETLESAYTGVVTGVFDHPSFERILVEVLGGLDVHKTWDIADLKLINKNVAPPAPGWGNDEDR